MTNLRNDFVPQPDGTYKSHCGRGIIYRDAMRPNIACWLLLVDGKPATNIYGQPRTYANPRAAAAFARELQ